MSTESLNGLVSEDELACLIAGYVWEKTMAKDMSCSFDALPDAMKWQRHKDAKAMLEALKHFKFEVKGHE
jgi:hypothetical protein